MSDLSRKQRLIGKARQLLDKAIKKGDIRFGIEILKTIAVLEGWIRPQNASKKSVPATDGNEPTSPGADWAAVLSDEPETEA